MHFKNFAKSQMKAPALEFLFNKVTSVRAVTLLKRDSKVGAFV